MPLGGHEQCTAPLEFIQIILTEVFPNSCCTSAAYSLEFMTCTFADGWGEMKRWILSSGCCTGGGGGCPANLLQLLSQGTMWQRAPLVCHKCLAWPCFAFRCYCGGGRCTAMTRAPLSNDISPDCVSVSQTCQTAKLRSLFLTILNSKQAKVSRRKRPAKQRPPTALGPEMKGASRTLRQCGSGARCHCQGMGTKATKGSKSCQHHLSPRSG